MAELSVPSIRIGAAVTDLAALPYRPCVGVMLVNAAGLAFVGKRIDNREGDFWQMPQGGIDDGEDLDTAALRELAEETGIGTGLVALIAQSREELFYDLPDELLGKLWGGRYRGQRQHWLLARFFGDDKESLVRVIAAGVGGTAMPSWGSSLTAKQLWGLAYYVESIAMMRGSPEAKTMRKSLLEQPAFAPPEPKKPEPIEAPPAATEDAPAEGKKAPN